MCIRDRYVSRRVESTELEILGIEASEKTRLASLIARLQPQEGNQLRLNVTLHLHPLAFDFDRQIANKEWQFGDLDEARRGNLPATSARYESRRALGQALQQLHAWPGSTLTLGPGSDLHTLNGFGGVSMRDATTTASAPRARKLKDVLDSVAIEDSTPQAE